MHLGVFKTFALNALALALILYLLTSLACYYLL